MSTPFLSRFSPSTMPAAALEAIFVKRGRIASRAVDLIADSAATAGKHHQLLVGPRGIGKTHLVSLIYYRVRALPEVHERLVIAWLREEEWGITSFLDLLLRVLQAITQEYQDAALTADVARLQDLPRDAAGRAAAALLGHYVRDRSLLVVAENLDEIFQGLGDAGQKQLRAHIQEHPYWIVLATTQSLFNGVSLRSSPFYGFFHITHLEELSTDESTELLAKIARYQGDHGLAELLETPLGRARVRAIHHLARGNPRVYVILSQFLSSQDLDDLVGPFMRTLDELTPYYQMRMSWLSPQQRKIVEILASQQGATPVKVIARSGFMSQQTASSQLRDLRDKGYVRVTPVGRESYYELREPLLRMCIDLKGHGEGPLQVFIELLRLWYTREELQGRLAALPVPDRGDTTEHEYIIAALHTYDRLEARTALAVAPAITPEVLALLASSDFAPNSVGWEDIYDHVAQFARRIASRYRLDANDLAQDAALALMQRNNRHAEPKAPRNSFGYVYNVVLNTARSKVVSEVERELREVPWGDLERLGYVVEDADEGNAVAAYAGAAIKRDESATMLAERLREYWLDAADSRHQLEQRMVRLSRALAEFGAESVVSEVLLDGLRVLVARKALHEANNWSRAAKGAFGSRPGLSVALNLLEVALTSLGRVGDARPLLKLPVEQRSFVANLLESPPSADRPNSGSGPDATLACDLTPQGG
jgi:DNA-binding transcriptional ArsR family regulator